MTPQLKPLFLSLSIATLAVGSVAAEPTASLPETDFGLSVLWNRELGSGYSEISIAGDKAVTMFTSDEVDVVAALDPVTGTELWRYELDEVYRGHSGSDDGPLSSPLVADGRVYVLAPRGLFAALSLEDGSEIWRYQLDEENSSPPHYGYTTSPVLAGGNLLLATGGEGHSMTAFDPATGDVKWQAGNDTVRYQTPTLLELDGKSMVVIAGDDLIQGFNPATGELHFEFEHGEAGRRSESSQVIPTGDDRFLVNHFGGESGMYRLAGDSLEEVWRSRAFRGSLAEPVYLDGHLYGYTGQFLTCADAETGEILWRSRPPLARNVSNVDGRLASIASSGDLVLIDPSPEGYREITRINAFDQGDYADATFSDGTFLVRNLERIAAISVDLSAAPQLAEIDMSSYVIGDMREWVDQVMAMPEGERQAAVDTRFEDVDGGPLFEDGGIVHFYWRGEAEDVGIQDNGGNIVDQAENGMMHMAGTDLFVRSSELDPKAQYTYSYTVNYGDTGTDPSNPYTVDNGFNVVSDLRMPEWPEAPHLDEPAEDAPRGELDTFQFRSELLENTRQIQVYRPHGYGSDAEARYPVLVVNHGDNLLRGGLMRNSLDNLIGTSVAPVVAVFVPRVAGPEYGGPQVDDYLRFLTEELLPHVDRHYQTDPGNRGIMGPGSAGLTSVYAALKHSDQFQRVAAQSLYPIEPAYEQLAELLPEASGLEAAHLVWSRRDYDLGDGRTAEGATKALVEMMRGAEVNVTEQVSDYSPGWGGWRGQHDEMLAALFPIE